MTLRVQDHRAERIIASFLDNHFYSRYVQNFQRFDDEVMQLKGVDVAFDYQGVIQMLVDEKAATHFVNKDIPTFAFELDFIGRDGLVKEGWLTDREKQTQYYLLVWVWAKNDMNFDEEDIEKLEIALVSRSAIMELLKENEIDTDRLRRIADHMRSEELFGVHFKKYGRPFYFSLTKHLEEQPCNVVIHKRRLIELSLLHKLVTKNQRP